MRSVAESVDTPAFDKARQTEPSPDRASSSGPVNSGMIRCASASARSWRRTLFHRSRTPDRAISEEAANTPSSPAAKDSATVEARLAASPEVMPSRAQSCARDCANAAMTESSGPAFIAWGGGWIYRRPSTSLALNTCLMSNSTCFFFINFFTPRMPIFLNSLCETAITTAS